MKLKSNLLQVCLWSGVLGMSCLVLPDPAHGGTSLPRADSTASKPSEAIPWPELGARAGANYAGDGLAVSPAEGGARLRCVFQRLEGEATREGLWLTSTAEGKSGERFRLKAVAVTRSTPRAQFAPMTAVQDSVALPDTGTVEVAGDLVRFIRPGLVEEYSVSMDGVRQDFLIEQRLPGAGQLRVELAVSGAKVEPSAHGPELVLEQSGRKIAYNRLRATDAAGRELPARMEVQETLAFSPQPLAFHLALVVDDAFAVYPICIDPTFSDANWVSMGGIPGALGIVRTAVADGSGNLYIGGDFTIAGRVLANHIAKWDGTSWSALGSGISGLYEINDYSHPGRGVYALAVSGNDLYVGGSFTIAGGVSATNIAKWNGTTWSALASGLNNYVLALAVSGSELYAGGTFTRAGGSPANRIAKWDGSSWSPLGSGISGPPGYPNFGGSVRALAVLDEELYAGGTFTMAGEVSVTNIAKWNGTIWTALGSGLGGGDGYNAPRVHALAVSGNELYAGGYFTTAGEALATNIAKWDGSIWSALGSGLGTENRNNPPLVNALAVLGNDLYAGGYFTTAGGVSISNIAKWNGTSWTALASGMNKSVQALAVSGTVLYTVGSFTTAGGNPAICVAQWDGSSWSALGSGMNGSVYVLAVSGRDLYAGGSFTRAGGVLANCIAKWNGTSWSPLGLGIGGRFPYVLALVVSGSDVFVGGSFTTAGGMSATNIAKWDGSIWSALGSGMGGLPPGYSPDVYALALLGGGLYVGGHFTTAGGTSATNIAKWDGSIWSALGSGTDGPVYALVASSNELYVGGAFTAAGGVLANCIAKWNGTGWSSLGSGVTAPTFTPSVRALAVSGSDLYAGGYFTAAGGSPATNIAKWSGTSWSVLGSGMSSGVSALAVSGSDLYAGGYFTAAGGSPATNIAKWSRTSWSVLGSGMSGGVSALAVSGRDLYAGGSFTIAGGKVSAYLARAVLGDPPGYNQLTGTPLSDGAMQFSYIGYPATNYALDRSFNLAPPVTWEGQQTNTMTVSGVLQFTNTPAPGTNNFWRVRSVP